MDIVDAQTRSRMMAGISGKDTRPELQIRGALHALGYRFRLHRKDLPGRPDIVLPRFRAAVFVNGCFWHGHDCHLFRMPSTRREFWKKKIEGNVDRDHAQHAALISASWRVLTIWECALKGKTRVGIETVMAELISWLQSDQPSLEIRGGR